MLLLQVHHGSAPGCSYSSEVEQCPPHDSIEKKTLRVLTAADAPARLVEMLAAPLLNRTVGLMDTCGLTLPVMASPRPASWLAMDVNRSAIAWSARCNTQTTGCQRRTRCFHAQQATSSRWQVWVQWITFGRQRGCHIRAGNWNGLTGA